MKDIQLNLVNNSYPTKPEKFVDEVLLEKLSKLHLSDKVISDLLQISPDTLHRRYADKMSVWRAEAKAKVAEILYDEAVNNRSPWALKLYVHRFLDSPTLATKDLPSMRLNEQLPVPMTNEEIVDMYKRALKRAEEFNK